MANDRNLPYNLETPDTGKSSREHRAGEVMSIANKINDGVYISATAPDVVDRYQGQVWIQILANDTIVWICDHNKNFTIQLG